MMHLSSLSKARWLVALAALGSAVAVLAPLSLIVGQIASLCALLGCVAALWWLWKTELVVRQGIRIFESISNGRFDARFLNIKERGNLGQLMHLGNRMIDMTDTFMREMVHTMDAVTEGRYYRKVIETGMSGLFLRSARQVNMMTDFMQNRINKFSHSADSFESSVGAVIGRVSDAAEEMTHAVGDINDRLLESARIAAAAHVEAGRTNDMVMGLAEAARQISEVTRLISVIADQTNLLALNATIEAARAGGRPKRWRGWPTRRCGSVR
jgi:methyl-accepting chemotaxis protein